MKLVITIRLTIFFSLLNLVAYSQQLTQEPDSVNTNAAKKNEFFIGGGYQSALHYYGHTDSLRSYGLFPFLGINFKTGIYIQSHFIFAGNNQTEYAGTIAEGGYNFGKEAKWSGNIFFSKTFYNQTNTLVQSAIKTQAGLKFTTFNKYLNVTAGSDLKFSNNTDFGATLGIDHIIRIDKLVKKAVIVINPSAYAFAGTQYFTRTYYQKRNLLIFPVAEEQVNEKVKEFGLLSLEFSLPAVLVAGNFQVFFIPAYVLPQNIIPVENSNHASQQARKMFYGTAGLKYTFRGKG